jgi:hypothetical protein
MYHGFIGPYPFLRGVLQCDGELCYDHRNIEMFVHILVFGSAILGVRHYLTSQSTRTRVPRAGI